MTTKGFLRTLRTLDAELQDANRNLSVTANLSADLAARTGLPPADLSLLERRADAARAAYDAHAALHPDLAREYEARAELAEAVAFLKAAQARLDALTPPPEPPPADPSVTAALLAEEERAAQVEAAAAAAYAAVLAADAEYQALIDNPRSPRIDVDLAAVRAERVGKRWKMLDRRNELARERVEAARRKATKHHAQRQAALDRVARYGTERQLAAMECDRYRTRVHELRASLPETEAAPLKEQREKRPPVPARYHAALRERYTYDPTKDELRSVRTGELVRSAEVEMRPIRVKRAELVRILSNPTDPAALDPTDFA